MPLFFLSCGQTTFPDVPQKSAGDIGRHKHAITNFGSLRITIYLTFFFIPLTQFLIPLQARVEPSYQGDNAGGDLMK